MRSPASMEIVQVDITDACESRCGACTRLVPHVSKPFYMKFDQFTDAVKAMAGWPGKILGVMGGNPVLHPNFAMFSYRFAELWGRRTLSKKGRLPIGDFAAYARERLNDMSSRRGLWSSLGHAFYRHLEVIHDVYDFWCVNDHFNDGLHQGLLIGRQEFQEMTGISDAEWVRNRDNCWVQRTWSATTNVHGAYFCEVASAIDNLFYGGKHAWPIEPGWWKRRPADFASQLHLCDHCALAQPGPSVIGNRDTDIVGRLSLPLLEAVGSPAIKRNQIEVYDPKEKPEHRHKAREFRTDWYMPAPDERVSPRNTTIRPHKVTGIVVSVGFADRLRITLPNNLQQLDELVVVTTREDLETRKVCTAAAWARKIILVESDACYQNDHAFNKGAMINRGLAEIKNPDWIVCTDADILLHPHFGAWVSSHSLNPGCLHGTMRVHLKRSEIHAWLSGRWLGRPVESAAHDLQPNGYFQLWNRVGSIMCRRWPNVMSENFCSAGGVDSWFYQQFPEDRIVMLAGGMVAHIDGEHEYGLNWNGQKKGKAWRQFAMVAHDGFIGLKHIPAPGTPIMLVDTLEGRKVEFLLAESGDLPHDVIKCNEQGVVFQGREIGHHHVHVSYYGELPCGSA